MDQEDVLMGLKMLATEIETTIDNEDTSCTDMFELLFRIKEFIRDTIRY